jgi:hypothetical protein
MYVLVTQNLVKKGVKIMESNKKMQCWDYNNCSHGKDALCPAVDQKAGRSCWLVAKTLCGGKVHGKHAKRIKSCDGCGFYIYMQVLLSKPSLAHQLYNIKRGVEALRSSLPHKVL